MLCCSLALRRTLISALTALALACNACSLTFVDTVPDHPEQLKYFDCTSTAGLPVADGVFALANGLAAGMTLSQSESEYADDNNGASRNVAAGISIGTAAVFAGSAVYGIVHSVQCSKAKKELRRRLLGNEADPAQGPPMPGDVERTRTPLGPPPPPPPGPAPMAPPPTAPPLAPPPPGVAPSTPPPAGFSPAPPPSQPAPNQPAPSPPPSTP